MKNIIENLILDSSPDNIRFEVEDDTNLELRIVGSKAMKKVIEIDLAGSGASANIKKLLLGKGNDVMKLDIRIVHSRPETRSSIESRCVMRDSSKVDFNGFIEMTSNSSGSVGNQSMKAILLSDKSQAKFVPSLKIDTNDVKVGHSSSIGRISEEILFYLMSRGLTQEEAVDKVIEGFVEPMKSGV